MLLLLIWFFIGISTSYCSISSQSDVVKHPNWPKDVQDDCGISYADRIIGGKNASLGQFPWLARIGYNKRKHIEYECGGTLVSKYFVVTAAHCVTNLPPNIEVKSIVLGENNANTKVDCDNFDVCADPPQEFGPEKIIFPSNYNHPAFRHDIALIKLNREAKISEWVTPICLPFGESLSLNLTNLTGEVAGWGLTNSDDEAGTPFLQTVKMPVHSHERCVQLYRTIKLGREQICVGGVVGKDSCGGDSGGPLMMVGCNFDIVFHDYDQQLLFDSTNKAVSGSAGPRYFIFGIVSFGSKNCGESELPGIYTDLRYYLTWILQNFSN